jgi:hypothetical protein
MLRKLLVLILFFSAVACTEEIITNPDNELVVVSGFLRAGERSANIKLTKTLPLGTSDSIPSPINDAEVFLTKNGINYKLAPSLQLDGNYSYLDSDLLITSGELFSLRINYKEEIITASTIVPNKPTGVSISKSTLIITSTSYGMGFSQDTSSIYLRWNNPDSTLYYVVLENTELNPSPISQYTPQRNISRTMVFPPMATNQFIINRRNLTYLGNHRAIVYKVNQEYADLYESRSQDSRNLNEPITNIKNGLGVFSAFASDTTTFYVKTQ